MAQFRPKLTFRAGAAAGRGHVCLAGTADEFDATELYSRVVVYMESHGHRWRFWEADYRVVSICLWTDPLEGHGDGGHSEKRRFVSLSEEGDVVIMEDSPVREKIKEAVVFRGETTGWGYLTDMHQIGNHLYACGSSGQVYRRESRDNWVHMDAGILGAGESRGPEYSPQVIRGRRENAIYLAGCEKVPGFPVRADFWNGDVWQRLALPPGTGGIADIYVESDEHVWMCGANGTLIIGNAYDGFKSIAPRNATRHHSSLCKFGEKTYIGSNCGLFVYNATTPNMGVRKVITRMNPELQDANIVKSIDCVLWSIGPKDIARFNGDAWERIQHPDNAPIGRRK